MAGGGSPSSGVSKLYQPYCKRVNIIPFALVILLCSASYLLGVWQHSSSVSSSFQSTVLNAVSCDDEKGLARASMLDFAAHHTVDESKVAAPAVREFPACDVKYSEYTPCEDRDRSLRFDRDRLIYRERHCPAKEELFKCLIPAPAGYKTPFPWPISRDTAWFSNVPHKELTVEKAVQNWIRVEGNKFRFPGGGTMFSNGADAYIDEIERLIPLRNGSIRTAVDTGCGVASWGAYLLTRNILTMSFAPRDSHEAQVQFALERGVPAMIGVLATNRLPYPARVFDMAHCSRCLIPWHLYGGQNLIEVDRILRPGGYWILSGPPINWRRHWKGWQRTEADLKAEQDDIETLATSLCWKKIKEKGDIAIWQKPTNHIHCKIRRRVLKSTNFCNVSNPDSAWYTKMETCITPLPEVSNIKEIAGGALQNWPLRLMAVPPRIASGSLDGVTVEMFLQDTELWKKRLGYYKTVINQLGQKGRYRNLLDMNAKFGSFAAALIDDPVWVMNVVPTEAKINTLGVIYERGLIGIYQDWCEAMSTYPRTYDLLHADALFSLYNGRCEMEDILLEMDRILRPEGAVIFRDDVDVLVKVKSITDGMRWDSQIVDHEDGPLQREKLLLVVKTYWTASNQGQDQPDLSAHSNPML
ncbi:putative methyltransferase PMT15 [Curcuma longa]|uniref:putative methyltransferase PMT15 n=1 Tax=Curcuma longa TaxID=136217 RepID=UPI003D9E545D